MFSYIQMLTAECWITVIVMVTRYDAFVKQTGLVMLSCSISGDETHRSSDGSLSVTQLSKQSTHLWSCGEIGLLKHLEASRLTYWVLLSSEPKPKRCGSLPTWHRCQRDTIVEFSRLSGLAFKKCSQNLCYHFTLPL